MAERTVLDFYRNDVHAPRRDHYIMHTPEGSRSLSTEEFFSRTAALAESLSELGIGLGDRVVLMSDNRPEWHIVDLAVLDVGAIDVPAYATLTPAQVAYQCRDSGAVAAIADTAEQMAKFLAIKHECPELKYLIQIEAHRRTGVKSLEALISSGSIAGARTRFWERAEKLDPSNLMTIIYTSGTTGDPKGVMLTHDNMVQNVLHSAHRVPVTKGDMALEFLPICHVLERMVGYIYMWRATTRAYCSVHHVGDLISEIKPTVFVGVPRFFEKVQLKIMNKVSLASPVKRSLFNWAFRIGRSAAHKRIKGETLSGLLKQQFELAEKLVYARIREAFGGRLRYCLSGGAELPLHVSEFFHALDICLIEGYGLTETSPVITVNGVVPGELRLGTVGKPLTNLELKIEKDGELLVKGPSVMKGYWNKPKQTAEVFDNDGFFHTGDIAEFDDDGFLLIVDRKKDIIVTAGGKNVAPQPIEIHFKKSPFVDTAVLIGDRKPYIVVLFSPDFDTLKTWAREHGISEDDPALLIQLPEIRQHFAKLVASTNAPLARYEQIKKFDILPVALTTEDGHLTPTLKVKRRVIAKIFKENVDALYS